MLTWAMVYATKLGVSFEYAIPYLVAMGCDVAIFYDITQAFNHCGV